MKKFSIQKLALVAAISTTLTACNSSSPLPAVESLKGSWLVETIIDVPIIAKSQVELSFNTESILTGTASCNNITSNYAIQNNSLNIGSIATTRKMCLPALMDQESNLLQALSKTKRFQLNNGQLSIFDQKGSLLLQATRKKQ